jgi:iron(III) transport system substrate-binding protein
MALLAAWYFIARRTSGTLVVYCTHDLVYAEPVLEEFSRQTGIPVTIVGDTEATKSLGLIERLLREGEQSPCDLFWNNEILGTIRLQQKGLLAPYTGPASLRIPERFKDREGYWHGFAGRMRVWIFPAESTGMDIPSRFADTDLSRLAIAKPLYGTTFSQFAMLWKLHGAESAKTEHRSLVERQCRFVAGNAMVRDLVAGGSCDLGMTDTDDVFAAHDAGHRMEMIPIQIDGKTLCIPNTVSILRSSDRSDEAVQLLEYLLSESVELQLARTARQIPLGTTSPGTIPAEVLRLTEWASESWNVADAADVAEDCLDWLKSEYAR